MIPVAAIQTTSRCLNELNYTALTWWRIDPGTNSKKYVENLNQGLDKRPGEMMIYLPPVPDTEGLFFGGSSREHRDIKGGYAAEVLQFVCIELGWFWQDRLEPGKDNYGEDYKN